jgi:hypothetical protein
MSYTSQDGGSNLVRYILLGAAVVYVAGSIFFMVQAQNRLTDLENRQKSVQQEMAKKVDDANGQTRASIEVIADKVGITQKDLAKKASVLQTEEAATQQRLKADEEATKTQFTAVNGAVDGVKGQVNKVSADVSDTRNDLAATKGKLETAIGDINKHSELIATNHDQLEQLKHKGERDYVEFTLYKGKDPTRIASVSLQLKKVDPKKGQYTLYVMADDKKIEKKDRALNEPLQFYTGRDRNLFEVVVNAADKNAVSGYMSTPKNMAANVVPDPRAAQSK